MTASENKKATARQSSIAIVVAAHQFQGSPTPEQIARSSLSTQARSPAQNNVREISLAVLGGRAERSKNQDVDVAVNAGCMRQSGVG